MNIYIQVEISARELDSKLLLAVIAAARGHEVIVSDHAGIEKGLRNNLFEPGIFHTKCITPFDEKINFHQNLIQKGYLITSIDEEAGLDMESYEEFMKTRYSEQTIQQSSAVFFWGNFDSEYIKKNYLKYKSKIHKTGSPRVDLWKLIFLKYWRAPKTIPKKPYLLVSSNMGKANYIKPFHEMIRENKNLGFYERDEKMFKNTFYWTAEEYQKVQSFIEAIKYLANNNSDFDIVFRPHPVEAIDSWKYYFEELSNVHVTREDAITPWIHNSFALMHCGCTTAIEATIIKKPIISFAPFTMNYSTEFTNNLGFKVKNLEELSIIINNIFHKKKSMDQNDLSISLPELLSERIYLDKNELAAEKIVKLWEGLDNNNLSKHSNWRMYQCFLKLSEIKQMIGKFLRKFFPKKFSNFRDDLKFDPLNKDDILGKVSRLKNILGIEKKLVCKLLTKRTILIRSI